MSAAVSFALSATQDAPVKGLRLVAPSRVADTGRCESYIHIGLFFDGTLNNLERDEDNFAHSNIARLSYAYREDEEAGYFPVYIPGVGTPFPEIGDAGTSSTSSAFGIGCEERVLFGLLAVYNAMHQYAHNGTRLFSKAQVKALCRNNAAMPGQDLTVLKTLGVGAGLRMPTLFGDGPRVSILQRQARELEHRLGQGKPHIVECFVDVFGFSRGAAEARVFCSWLNQLLSRGKLAGVRIRLRFLGLFDTVASAGFVSGVAGAVFNTTAGHEGWADAAHLRIPANVENCVHMIAMHELRKNFPLDSIRQNGVLPPRCQEFAYPGSHSDVGGGYAPGELGISIGASPQAGDALKLSQIPLNHMLSCAMAAGVPMNIDNAKKQQKQNNPFEVAPETLEAFNAFLKISSPAPRRPDEWLLPYLAWRWQVRNTYTSLHHVRHAGPDRQLLLDANATLTRDAHAIQKGGRTGRGNVVFAMAEWMWRTRFGEIRNPMHDAIAGQLDSNAPAVLKAAQMAPQTPEALAKFFDRFVHDSFAGFCKSLQEPTGYWRYRESFDGNNNPMPSAVPEARKVNS